MKTLEEIIRELPPEAQDEVRDFAVFLLERNTRRSRRKPKFDWAGSAKDLRDKYTSVELQHEISKWRAGTE